MLSVALMPLTTPEEWEESQWMCEDYGESLGLQEFCMWFDEEGCMPAANLYPPCDEGDCYDNSIFHVFHTVSRFHQSILSHLL